MSSSEPSDPARHLRQSSELLWSQQTRPSRGPRPGLTLRQIVDAAITVADTEGLEALSMRRVARELGVGTMSLYRYVPDKSVLLDLMLDRVSQVDPELDRGKDWRGVLESVARCNFELYLRHRWLLQVNWARPVFGPNTLAGVERTIHGLRGTPLTDRERIMVMMTIDSYCVGLARSYVQYTTAPAETGISDEEFWKTQVPVLEQAMATGDYPTLAGLDEDAFEAGWEETFEFGLQRLLDGLATLLETRRP